MLFQNVNRKYLIGLLCIGLCIILIFAVRMVTLDKKEEIIAEPSEESVYADLPAVTEEEKELSLSEQLERAFEMGDSGFVDEGGKMFQEIMLEHQDDPDAYLCLSEMYIERQEVESAKEFLLLGFEKTEDSRLMDEYLNISMQYAEDGNGEFYEKLFDFAEMYAQVTDNEEKLEVAKKIYVYVKANQIVFD